eukprot:CAMPEP_0185812804 /NCGR_PEP_ID=MMETSP1322-20130828/10012_1 /TAXON_ID=265543 /ORGANISM="Minutocellus polymorphus, Strain RCC2270" /LENGTH=50 /DNA_ID=CAMNT_0028509383 /DNA_START=93 /DNA_END=241 /DNA_ORIENTATION=-
MVDDGDSSTLSNANTSFSRVLSGSDWNMKLVRRVDLMKENSSGSLKCTGG